MKSTPTPSRTRSPRGRRIAVAAAVIWDGDRLLLTQRPPGDALALMWEFPGGKLERGEDAHQALVREVHEELGVVAVAVRTLGRESHAYPHGLTVDLTFIECTVDSFEFRPSEEVHGVRWMRVTEIDLTEVLEADRPFLSRLRAQSEAAASTDEETHAS
jgi:8-oxo-dGTP diphosphatase